MEKQFNFNEAKEKIDLPGYLSSLGCRPAKIQGEDFWYYSPFHDEKTPSFKVNERHQIWYDHSIGTGGDLIDFGMMFHGCTHAELLQKFKDFLSLQQHEIKKDERILYPNQSANTTSPDDKKIKIVAERPIFKFYLKSYLRERCIPLDLANQYLKEVDFINLSSKNPEQIYTALGFKNDKGGYELRSKNFKSSSAPKGSTFLAPQIAKPMQEQSVAVFEGFFNLLSYQLLYFHNKINTPPADNFLVLNSLSFFKSSLDFLDAYGHKMLFLDNDKSGKAATDMALNLHKNYKDYSHLYANAKDLNAHLIDLSNPPQVQTESMKIHR